MINYKILKHVAWIALAVFITFSCDNEDYLETTSKENLTDGLIWSSYGNADIFLNDIYSNLVSKGNDPDNLDNFTDDNDAGYYYTSYNWKKGIVTPTSNSTNVWFGQHGPNRCADWEGTYKKVRKCNIFLAKLAENKANFPEEWYNKRVDEVRFLRAFFYSELFYRIGGLSIITVPQDRMTMTEPEMYVPRSTFEETVDFLVGELTSIVSNGYLAVKYNSGDNDAGRATLGAALALKGYVQLFAASPAYNSDETAVPNIGASIDLQSYAIPDVNRWAAAAATNKQFIDTYGPNGTGDYDLFPAMATFWQEKNEYNSEVIFDRQHVANTMANTFDTYGGPVWILGGYYTWGNYCPTQELVDDYQMANGLDITDPASGYDPQNPYIGREKRFYDFIVYDGAPYKQDWMPTTDTIYTRIDLVNPSKNEIDKGNSDVGNTGYYFKKRLDNLHSSGGSRSGMNYVYYRYAEVLLNYAEAQNEAVGPDASVYEAINAIRTRPGTDLPELTPGLSQAEMRATIKRERRIELVFENKRLFDLWRWKDAMELCNTDKHGMEITNTVPEDNSGVWVYNKISLNHPHVFTQKMYFNPIPQAVIDRNEYLTQNWGY
ncbi:MAG: RagB/SusD family nutrient uptake outer membrane protein [Bacteroidales bacterium]|nr:RagB/SusD family nutrient uptake outer membrane protein [Bacteroidales bacterium]